MHSASPDSGFLASPAAAQRSIWTSEAAAHAPFGVLQGSLKAEDAPATPIVGSGTAGGRGESYDVVLGTAPACGKLQTRHVGSGTLANVGRGTTASW